MKLAVVSHSGGLDSSTLMGYMLEEGYIVRPLNLKYGQENIIETKAQDNVVEFFKEKYGENQVLDTINIDLNSIVTPIKETVENFRKNGFGNKKLDDAELNHYFPSRNILFSSIAAILAETYGYLDGLKETSFCIGIHKHVTYPPYWDITPEFANALQNLVNLNNAIKVNVETPFVEWEKADIVRYMLDKKKFPTN